MIDQLPGARPISAKSFRGSGHFPSKLGKAVYVDVPDKSSGKRKQRGHIKYDLLGYIPVDERLKMEPA